MIEAISQEKLNADSKMVQIPANSWQQLRELSSAHSEKLGGLINIWDAYANEDVSCDQKLVYNTKI
jgi:hypothetical protein